MSFVPASVKCDGCGKDRIDDTNKWNSMRYVQGGIQFVEGIGTEFSFHACGDACASKLFARWLATGKVTE